jgi:hypothetical protein
MVRAKMKLTSISETSYGAPEPERKLRFDCVYDSAKNPEDVGFTKATPTGSAEFRIDNPDALAQFKVGEYYYVDFSPVPPVAPAEPDAPK